MSYLEPVRRRRQALLANPGHVDELIEYGGQKARQKAELMLAEVRRAMNVWA